MSFLEPGFVYFLLLFFPLYFVLGASAPRAANLFVALASFLFVAWYYPPFSLIVLFQMGVIHGFHRRWLSLAPAIALVLAPLVVFKYSAFFGSLVGLDLPQLPLPLGISFYSFTAVAVMVEMSRDSGVASDYNPSGSLKILTFWPHLASGPILRPVNVWRPYVAFRDRDWILALVLVVFGLFKKVVIADGAGTVVARGLELGMGNLSAVDTLYLAIGMSVQIYGDFSGYSDMAIGFAIMIGVRLPANFNYPYLADSVSDFWRRWHISLTSWFRDYLYIPLGGSRAGSGRTLANIMVVFLISGLWHGAAVNFILWGALHGAVLIFERLTSFHRLPGLLKRAVVLPVIVLSWLVFFLDLDALALVFDRATLVRPDNPDALGAGVLLFAGLLALEHWFRPYRVDREGFPAATRVGIVAAPLILVATTVFWSEPLPFIYFDF